MDNKISTNEDVIDFDTIRQSLNLQEKNSFKAYLKEIYKDLADRRDNKKTGISKLTFMEYMKLPVLICEKLFQSLDNDNDNFLNSSEFIEGLTMLYTGSFEETAKIIFNIYDVEKNGEINVGNVKVILSFLPLKTDKTKTEYKYQMESLQEITDIIQQTFGKKKTLLLPDYLDTIQNRKSDTFLQLLCFLYQRKPFNEDIIKMYKANPSPIKNQQFISPQQERKNFLASPSKKSMLSPVHNFLRKNTNVPELKFSLLGDDDDEEEDKDKVKEDKVQVPTKKFSKQNTFTDKGATPELSGYKGMIRMTNQIVETVVKTSSGSVNKDYKKVIENSQNTFDSPSNFLKKTQEELPEFSLEKNLFSMEDDMPITEILDHKENQINNSNEKIQFEDYIYKLSESGKVKKYFLVLSGKDIIYYKDNKKEEALGLHNLSGTFVQENGEAKLGDKMYYSFSIVFSSKSRNYYCPDKATAKNWTASIRKAIGYHNFFDYYEMLDEIGEGKFGLVKLGIHFKTKERVAIKIINKESMEISDLELVKNEIDIMKLCRHPNVVRLLDHFENSEYIFLVMEYLSGGDLGNYLNKKNFKFSEKQAADIMYQIANGLNYLHSYGVLHRDLKPDNIMISKDDEKPIIKIMDFGLSKILTPLEKVTDGFGTLSFVAPEVLVRQPYNNKIDIWSMGIILYYMLTGALPFDDEEDNEEKIAKMIVFNEPNFPDKLFKNKSKELLDIIRLCLLKKPEERISIDEYLKHDWIKKYYKP